MKKQGLLLSVLLLIYPAGSMAQTEPLEVQLERRAGEVLLKRILLEEPKFPPDALFVVPLVRPPEYRNKEYPEILTIPTFAQLTGGDIEKFFAFLATPSDFIITELACPQAIVARPVDPRSRLFFSCEAYIDPLKDYVKLRFRTGDLLVPKADINYFDTGFGTWLKQRLINIQAKTH